MKPEHWLEMTQETPLLTGGSSATIYDCANGLVGGIGFGPTNARARAFGESLERFWLQRGPTSNFKVFRLTDEIDIKRVCFRPTRSNTVDSSGCALHPEMSVAFEKAALEFMERQSVIAHWRYGTPSLESSRVPHLPLELQGGEVHLRDVSIFPQVAVSLALYSSDHGMVQYAAGAGAELDPTAAEAKAINECAQAHLLMSDNVLRRAQGRALMDSIQETYYAANHFSTVDQWPKAGGSLCCTRASSDTQSEATARALLLSDILSAVKNPPFVGVDQVEFDGSIFHVVRIFSDDWFMGLHDALDRRGVLPDGCPVARDCKSPTPFG